MNALARLAALCSLTFGLAPSAMAATCAGAFDPATAYVGGALVSSQGHNYRAAWWTQGQPPAQNCGGAGSGQPWIDMGACGSGATPTAPARPTAPAAPATPSTPVLAAPAGSLFSPYKDVAISANWNTSVISTTVTGDMLPVISIVPHLDTVTWAFATGECGSESWGGIPGQALAAANVQAWAQSSTNYMLSTGGAAGSFTCGSDAGFAAFLDRYASTRFIGVDFDIEAGQSQDTINALVARVKTAKATSRYGKLRYSFTIATLGGQGPDNLGDAGKKVMQAIKAAGLQGAYVNLMAMDYGSTNANNCVVSGGKCDMAASAMRAATTLHNTYGVPYDHIELTVMVGGNDTVDETFALGDVTTLANAAKAQGLGGLHTWSLDRDKDCAPGYASPTCNSYGQAGILGFTKAFMAAYKH